MEYRYILIEPEYKEFETEEELENYVSEKGYKKFSHKEIIEEE